MVKRADLTDRQREMIDRCAGDGGQLVPMTRGESIVASALCSMGLGRRDTMPLRLTPEGWAIARKKPETTAEAAAKGPLGANIITVK